MTEASADLIDGAGAAAEELVIEAFVNHIPQGTFLALWNDPDDGELNNYVGQRRAQVLLDGPDDVEPYAIYQMKSDGEWVYNSGSWWDAPGMLGQFLEQAAEAAATSNHPCRRLVR